MYALLSKSWVRKKSYSHILYIFPISQNATVDKTFLTNVGCKKY